MVSIFVSTHPPRHANSSLTMQTAQKSRQTTHKKTQSQAINAQNPRTLAKKRPPRLFSSPPAPILTLHSPHTHAQTHKRPTLFFTTRANPCSTFASLAKNKNMLAFSAFTVKRPPSEVGHIVAAWLESAMERKVRAP